MQQQPVGQRIDLFAGQRMRTPGAHRLFHHQRFRQRFIAMNHLWNQVFKRAQPQLMQILLQLAIGVELVNQKQRLRRKVRAVQAQLSVGIQR